MRVIFLDFDGVINSQRSFKKEAKLNRRDPSRQVIVNQTLCPDATANLKLLMDQVPDAKVVISSTWRRIFDLDWLKQKLSSYGLDSSRVIGITPGTDQYDMRGAEIQEWLDTNPGVTNYVILDDNRILGHGFRFVQTTWNDGLLKKHVKKALQVFGINDEKA